MGSSFQYFDIILFAMIAVFLILRLRSALGRRDDGPKRGHRDPFARVPDKDKPPAEVIPLPGRSEPRTSEAPKAAQPADPADAALAAAFEQIHQLDRSFDPQGFASGARGAFEMILTAYASGDTKTLRSLLSPDVFSQFDHAVKERQTADQTLEATLVKFRSADVIEAWVEDRTANVTVKFVTEQVHIVRDKQGNVVEGEPNAIIDVTDIWTFARDTRSRDPNWALVATRSPH